MRKLWTLADSRAATREGWAIFSNGAFHEIQRDDEMSLFASDMDAAAHVAERAAAGSYLHIKACIVHTGRLNADTSRVRFSAQFVLTEASSDVTVGKVRIRPKTGGYY